MLERVENPLPEPTQCDCCASLDIQFASNAVLYGREFGQWPYCWHCSACGAAVGCHPGTQIPLGRMADKKTRKLRAEAHKHFDYIWKSGAMSRSAAYELLAKHLGIPRKECHISQLNVEQLRYAIEQCKGLVFDEQAKVAQRRKEKKNAKHAKRIERAKRQTFHRGERSKARPFFRRAGRSDGPSGSDFEGN